MRRVWLYLALMVSGLLFALPVWMLFAGSLKPDELVLSEAGSLQGLFPTSCSLQNYRDVFERVNFTRFLFNSLLITSLTVILGLLVNSLAAYALARLRWRGRSLALSWTLALLILPFEAIAVPLFYQSAVLGLRDSYLVQILPFVANAFSIWLFYSFFAEFPKELEQAARIDGAGPWRCFFRIVLPASRPVFASVAILTALMQWGSFLWPTLVTIGERVRPLPVAIACFQTLPPRQWGDILAFAVMMVLPLLVLFLLFQSWFVKGVQSAGLKG
ncbi:MAG: sugar ABC transporter permease [Planctomycetota bacterium]|nr:MAG: sugar ABC transporter permease [Planctomycetota bacterium]